MTLEIGTRLGHYRIIALLGRGGMADVYRAEDERLGREVALKSVPAEFARDPERVERFEREVRAAAGLTHANIVTVYEFGQEEGQHFYTMALMSGGDLKARIRANPEGMPPPEAREVAAAMARALDYAHQRGFVHRDVKPENILFGEEGVPRLTDFGIARAMAEGTRMTATGMSIGSPHYMSPEQARGLEVDGRSDLYSLGVVLYEMLTGRLPFDAADTFAVGYSHINDPVPELPRALAAWQPVLNRMLAKSPEDRYDSAGELAEVLASDGPSQAPATRVMPLERKVGPATGDRQSVTRRPEAAKPRPSLRAALAGAVLALAVAGIGYLALRDTNDPQTAPTNGGGGAAESRPAPVRSAAKPAELPSSPESPFDFAVQEDPTIPSREPARPQPRTSKPSRREARRPDPVVGDSREETRPAPRRPKPRPPKPKPLPVLGGRALLVVETTPSGAEVLVDGTPVGKTPLERSDIRSGVREVTLRHSHYETVRESSRRFNDGRVVRIQRTLVRGRGALTVTARPRQAWVEVEGKRLAEATPVTLENLPAGQVDVKLGASEHRPLAVKVEIPKNGLARLQRQLEPIPYGSLTLDLEPSDARVTLPEVNLRYRPGMRLPEGAHRVVVRRDGYGEATRTVNVSGDTRVRIGLEAKRRKAGESRVFDSIEFVWIPAGEFRMGSTSRHADSDEKPVTRVRISRGFYLGEYEVTQGQWESVMGSNPSRFKSCGKDCPVERVAWDDVQEFLRKLNTRSGGRRYRLPTEAEWEYAARGGTTTDTPAGDLRISGRRNAPLLDGIAWYAGNSGVRYDGGDDCSDWKEKQYRSKRCGTHPVGRKAPNGWGLHDMLGNVWEWVGDWKGDYPGGTVTDPSGPRSGSDRVIRGGGWVYDARFCRSAFRYGGSPGVRSIYLGFRLLRTE